MLRNTIYTKRKKTIHDLFFHQSTSYQQNLRILSKLYFSSSSTYSDSDYSSDKTTHFGYQTVSEKEKHENGRYNFRLYKTGLYLIVHLN